MSTVTEAAAVLCGTTRERYEASVDLVIFRVLNAWTPEDARTHAAAVRWAVRAAGTRVPEPPHSTIPVRRQWLVRDWMVRRFAPIWTEATSPAYATLLHGLPVLTPTTLAHALETLTWARKSAASAMLSRWKDLPDQLSSSVVTEAMNAAAWDGVRDAAGTGESDAVWRVVLDTLWNASYDAAASVAFGTRSRPVTEAAREPARQALRPTVQRLAREVLRLLPRLIRGRP